MDSRLEPGHCWISGKPLNEILATYAQDHPLGGHVYRVGKSLPETIKITLLMLDGRTVDLRIHEDHVREINLNELWHAILDREQFEYENRQHMENYNPELAKKSHENQIKLLCPPIAVLQIGRDGGAVL